MVKKVIKEEEKEEKKSEENFNYYCNQCKTPFDRLNSELACPWCQSSNVTFNQNPKKISKTEKKEEKGKESLLDIIAKFSASAYIECIIFFRKEKYTIPLFIIYLLMSYTMLKIFKVEDVYALILALLFIIIRKK